MKTIVTAIALAFSLSHAVWKVDVLYPDRETKTFLLPDEGMRIDLKSNIYICFAEKHSPTIMELSCTMNYQPNAKVVTNAFSTLASKTHLAILKLQEWQQDAKEDTLSTMHMLTLYWE